MEAAIGHTANAVFEILSLDCRFQVRWTMKLLTSNIRFSTANFHLHEHLSGLSETQQHVFSLIKLHL